MKRENPNLKSPQNLSFCNGSSSGGAGENGGYPMATTAAGKVHMWEETQQDNGMDELLAVLGYKVKSSDMAEIAQKIEQLEEFMGNVTETEFSQLGSDSVHYNPSDLSTWLESMLSELDPTAAGASPPPPPSFIDFAHHKSKRLKTLPTESTRPESSRPVILVDSQENGIRLVHALMACAESVQQNNLNLAESLVKQIGILAGSQSGAMRKVATYFAEALARRIYGIFPQNHLDHSRSDFLQTHFYESCPYLKFAHFTANQAILEAFEGKKRVHVIDFGINQGLQWPALMQALALRPGGPPAFRLTGIGPPAPDNSDYLQEVGWKLAQLAESIHVEFEFRGFVATSLADLNSSMFEFEPSQPNQLSHDPVTVAVNSVFELHKLLARPGSIQKVLEVIKDVKPEIVTIVEQEANHNGSVFTDRFTESLHYYSTLFDSLEGSVCSNHNDKVMSEVYLGKQICNVVACEGLDRVERHETLTQWRTRLESAGFVPAHLGSNAFKQASMLLALFAGGDGYTVEENGGCLMLGWHSRSLITTSAWKLGSELTQ